MHNIEEAKAMQRATAEAETEGVMKESKEFKARVEAARKTVLEDSSFRDARLSDLGEVQAHAAKAEIEGLTLGEGALPHPETVFVSPLYRTLQTAATIFPNKHHNCKIKVSEILRERRTGRPCDERKASASLDRHGQFGHMCFEDILKVDEESGDRAGGKLVEDTQMLQVRVHKLTEVLHALDESVLCLVTHKAFLRELERGPLWQCEAAEFGTGEVRVYDVVLAATGVVSATLRYRGGVRRGGAGATGRKDPTAGTTDQHTDFLGPQGHGHHRRRGGHMNLSAVPVIF